MGENKYKFQKLTPVKDADLTLYDEALNFIFENTDVHNVAISGAYGAGKSSILESYKAKNEKTKFLHISLAHFEQFNENDKEDAEVKVMALEGKILNQLIHQIPAKKIPQSNFKIKKEAGTKSIAVTAGLSVIFLMFIFHIIFFENWNNYVDTLSGLKIGAVLDLSRSPQLLLVTGLLCVLILYRLIWVVVKAQKNRNVFRKISLQGNEIELFKDNEDSYFDKYLNEVLYLFENSSADVIVFEDMDRFSSNRIFERLREINTLLNVRLLKNGKTPLRFFYLLRDDLFISKDRTKFFDYIVPIIPIIDSSNSYNKFMEYFNQGGIFELFDEGFLQELSLYVDDMRILKNIYNEFVVYYNCLNITELDCNKMLGIITYKNIFPRDFGDLQLNRGFVHNLFAKRESFIQTEVEQLNAKITEKQKEIELADKEHLLSLEELDIVYNEKRGMSYYGGATALHRSDQEEYNGRKLAIENKISNNQTNIEREISVLKDQIMQVQNMPMRSIITRDNIDEIFRINAINEIGHEDNFYGIKESDYFPLLKYLVRNGYIDETYADYMTYFYEGSLSRTDKMFLRSITDKKAKDFTYELKKPMSIVSRLRLIDFSQEEILNFDLFEYLLKTLAHQEFLNRFVQQLKETKNFNFVGLYFDSNRELELCIKVLNSGWPELFSEALQKKLLTEGQLRQYSIYSLYYSNFEEIKQMNEDNSLTQYISNSKDYLNIFEPNVEKLTNGFKTLKIYFVGIDDTKAEKNLFRMVYENSMYQLTFANITLMLEAFYSLVDESDIRHRNYTLVLLQPESPLAKYINGNISEYVEIILSNSDGKIADTADVIINVLDNEMITDEQKKAYIEQLITSIPSLAEVRTRNLWGILLSSRVAAYSAENVLEYFGKDSIVDDVLIDFIESGRKSLDFANIRNQYSNEKLETLFNAVLKCDKLSNEKYGEILLSLGCHCEEFSVEGLSEEKFDFIIDANILRMTSESLTFIREYYPTQILYFIMGLVKEYTDIMTDELFVMEELKKILTWPHVPDSSKLKLLEFTDESISVIGVEYSQSIILYILNHNLEPTDLPILFEYYDKWSDDIKQEIIRLAIGAVTKVTANPQNVSIALLKKIFASSILNVDQKTSLFAASLFKFAQMECEEIFGILKLPSEYQKIFDRNKRPSFEVNATNRQLLSAFVKAGIISKFEENQKKKGYYKIYHNKPASKTLPISLL